MFRNHAEPSRRRGFVTTRLAAGIAVTLALVLGAWWALRPGGAADAPTNAAATEGSGGEAFEAYAGADPVRADDRAPTASGSGAAPGVAGALEPNARPTELDPAPPEAPSQEQERPRVVYTPPPAAQPEADEPTQEEPPPFPAGPNDPGPRVGSVSSADRTPRIENPLPDERGAARPDLAFYQQLDTAYDGLAQALTGCARGLDPSTTDSLFVELTVTGNPDNPAQGVAALDLFGSEALTEGRAACAQAQIRALPLPAPSHARSGESGRYTVHAETAAEYSVIFEFAMGEPSP